MPANTLVLEKVVISLGGRELARMDTAIAPGEVFTVMGPSGSGKSTLLAFVAGFLEPVFAASGRVLCDGRDLTGLPPDRRRIGLLFQDALLFPHMSVGENLMFAMRAGGTGTARRAEAEEALREAGLEGFFPRDPATLSGGQKARAALMRILLSQPRALLLDEPFSRLDTGLRSQVRNFVFEEARSRKLPVLMVTHDSEDARAAGGRVLELG
ncbi:MAG: ATP-binding cassette domain-containing protein [Nitratireductor sp.]|nr:ATP-binding cassette domain-containing protein [Nitratireductor sp.]MCB1455278.1 ATP-binding cassette domain-containing protein [Nitratireductor sp.]MCB1459168.1 ATP-binding cassette domain-containing protein [Nitratireductor sp.]